MKTNQKSMCVYIVYKFNRSKSDAHATMYVCVYLEQTSGATNGCTKWCVYTSQRIRNNTNVKTSKSNVSLNKVSLTAVNLQQFCF